MSRLDLSGLKTKAFKRRTIEWLKPIFSKETSKKEGDDFQLILTLLPYITLDLHYICKVKLLL
ncbi:hypothetical protein P700755_002501 [Psychroflexus torquis ATCC 700755]|uniref:Uncharacterized protein n=1 Tax=Psychroflexus torquis (strain ATCC 700755 / CIP 106069 / ACAM 623) TaxID=313595 RepID=K4IUV8_PSYTT|nr:hypothetical protein P700755_002501 [Psychroflexus torquis ATCC 700755]